MQVLRLLETFAVEQVTGAIDDALQLGTISFNAVRHLLLCRMERRPPRLDMENYPHLPPAQVHTTQPGDCMALLMEVRVSEGEPSVTDTATNTADTPQVLLDHHLKELRLPTILREYRVPGDGSLSLGWEYDRVARQCAVEQVKNARRLLRITELE